ncbi:MAG TPA: hypothetical protein VFS80_17080 [Burkholderiales bacterium]|nr:hypothetical protein [Burkholderiales bacterium]
MTRTAAAAALAALLLLSGCASQFAPPYSPSIENVQMLRDAGTGKVRVGTFRADPKTGNDESISLRGLSLQSPVGGKFSAYVAQALASELAAARLIDDKAVVEISGVLIQNNVDVSGINVGTAHLQSRVVVRRAGRVTYNKAVRADMTFESSFAGGVAVPKAIQAYPILVQKFLAKLYGDRDFISSLTR